MKPIKTITELGSEQWRLNGEYHREDGPAYISESGDFKSWWINGKRHRLDGPAVIITDRPNEWWINGRQYDEEDFLIKIIQLNLKVII